MKATIFGASVVLALVCPAVFAGTGADLRLIDAIRNSDATAARALVKQGINVNAAQPDGSTALHWAVYHDDAETVDLLVRAKANVNAKNDFGATPLWIASSEGRAAMIDRLLRAGADPNVALLTGETPLMAASRTGNLEAVKLLLKRQANVNARESLRAQSALMWAVSEQHPEVTGMLIEFGADIRARTNVRHMLVNAGIDGNKRPTEDVTDLMEEEQGGFTPLLFAARAGDAKSAALLLDAGADVNDAAPTGVAALALAAHSDHPEVAKVLLERGADPNGAAGGYTALHAAILRGELDLVKALLAHHADPNALIAKPTPIRRNSQDFAINPSWVGVTPLWLAAKFSDADMMRALAAAGADPHFARKDGVTILMAPLAAGPGRHGITVPVARNPREVERQNLEAMKAAIEVGADVNAATAEGDTALHTAASGKLNSIVQFLVENGAKLDAKNHKGETPLVLASQKRPQNPYAALDEQPSTAAAVNTADLLRKLGATQ